MVKITCGAGFVIRDICTTITTSCITGFVIACIQPIINVCNEPCMQRWAHSKLNMTNMVPAGVWIST